jgi:hypothetical protein
MKSNKEESNKATAEDTMDIDWHDFVIVEEINLYEEMEINGGRPRGQSLDESVQKDLKR